MEEVSITIEEDLLENVNDQLDYGDSRSKWIREAIRMRLKEEGVIPEEGDESGNLKAEA